MTYSHHGSKGSSLNKVVFTLNQICNAHQMRPSFGFGPTSDFNANNETTFPAIWVEPTESKFINNNQGVRIKKMGLNIYAMDRISKGDINFQDLMSDTMYLLDTIVGYLRESEYCRYNYIMVDDQDGQYTPVMRDGDENVNGYKLKIFIEVPDVYNPCNSPFDPILKKN